MPTSTTTTPSFADAGAAFNDATTMLVGGVWQNLVSHNGQGTGSIGTVLKDLGTVQADLQAEVSANVFQGQALTDVNKILSMISQEMTAVTDSVNGVAGAATTVNTLHNGIISIVQGDTDLATAASANGGNGFQAPPPAFAAGVTAATASKMSFADIGVIFDDAAHKLVGGVDASNKAAILSDVTKAHNALQTLIHDHPEEFTGLTGVHADTIVRQLALEKQFINDVGSNPDAPRALNDNTLDIIDIVQGDNNLLAMANQNGAHGWSAFPDKANPTPKFLDDASQTNFWSNFIAQSNSLGDQAKQVVGTGDHAAINHLISSLHTFETKVTAFDKSQGGIFEARFDNELLGNKSTLGAEVDAMIKGLKTGNVDLVSAAADQMHANAADVGGNNIPVTGGVYNTEGRTVADVLPSATTVIAGATGGTTTTTPATPTPPATPANPANGGVTDHVATTTDPHDPAHGGVDMSHFDTPHHFGHMWG